MDKKEPLDTNRAAHLITDLNLELKMFLDKFINFRREFNIIDINLLNNLDTVHKEIINFINGNPENVNTEDRTNIDLRILKDNRILKLYVCDICQLEVGERSRDIMKHVDYYPTHPKTKTTKIYAKENSENSEKIENNDTNAIPRMGNKEAKKKKKEEKALKIIETKFPKKAKSFISGNFGEFLDTAAQIGKKLMQIPEYTLIEKNLCESLKPTFPDLKIYFFGSRMNGLSNPYSDLDILLDIGNIYHSYKRNENQTKKLNKVNELLRKNCAWKEFESVKKARVPILRAFFVSDKFQIDCDISFSHGLGHSNTLLMKYIFELQPICHKMCLFLKEWIKKTNLNEVISTYAFVLLTVYFLQVKNLLPPIKLLQDEIEKPVQIGPWQGDFVEKSLIDLNIEKIDDSNKTCFQYLKDYFKYFSLFKFDTLIVCPYLGKPIAKTDLHNSELENFPRYKTFYLMDPKENSFQTNKPVCIMDPLELNHNVTKGIPDKYLQLIKRHWTITYEELENRKMAV